MTTIGSETVTRGRYSLMSAAASRSIEVLTMPDAQPIIFVVDDDLSVRESLELLIKSAGWQPELFVSAQEFLSRPRPSVPCCLGLDVTLPGLSGLELQRQLAERTDMPIIFITGHGDVPMSVQAMKAGAVEFLTKPFKDDVLLDASCWAAVALHRVPAVVLGPATGAAAAPAHFPKTAQKVAQKVVLVARSLVRFPPG